MIAYDYFGMGRSPKESTNPSHYSTDSHTKDLVDLYNLLMGDSQRTTDQSFLLERSSVHVVGHSFGCSQALRLSHHILSRSKMSQCLRSITLIKWDSISS